MKSVFVRIGNILLRIVLILAVYVAMAAAVRPFLGAPDGEKGENAATAAELAALFRDGTKILALGEGSHNYPASYRFLEEVLTALSGKIDFLGFEISAEHQEAIDRFVRGETEELGELTHRISAKSTLAAFTSVLRSVRETNLARKDRPIRVLALDLPDSCCRDNGKKWFALRDEHMLARLRELTGGIAGRGILFMGAAHLSRSPFPMPAIAALMDKKAPLELDVLGSRLAREEPNVGVLRVWLDNVIFSLDEFTYIPVDLGFVYSLGRGWQPAERPRLIFTRDARFQAAEAEERTYGGRSYRISSSFDYFVALKYEIGFFREALVWLVFPEKIFRGLAQRLMPLFF